MPLLNDGGHRAQLAWNDVAKHQYAARSIDIDLSDLHRFVGTGWGREFVKNESPHAKKTSKPNETRWTRHFHRELVKVVDDYPANIKSLQRQLMKKKKKKA